MGKTREYQRKWKELYPWSKQCQKSKCHAICIPCGARLNIEAGGSILKSHGETKKHQDNLKRCKSQSVFNVNAADGHVSLDAPSKSTSRRLTSEEVLKTEIIRCLDIVDTNTPFHSTDSDNWKYREMFPDSEIAKNYHQKSDKVRYMIQFGIAPVVRAAILSDLKGKPFTFAFDETTTTQIKKQYDGYATFHSSIFKQIVTVYLGTLFVGRCTAADLINDFHIMMKKLDIDPDYIISLGMDGPNVNKSFASQLNEEFTYTGKILIDVGTCPLHTVSNGFASGLKILSEEIDLNEYCINLHSFFKHSAKRIEEYFKVDIITALEPQRMIRHVETRWLSLGKTLLRIMEQFKNIEDYFLRKLPAEERGFNGKSGVGNSARYVSIKKVTTDKRLMPIMAAATFIAQEFRSFLIPLQCTAPMITVLFDKMKKLLKGLLSLFMDEKLILQKSKKLKSIEKICSLDLSHAGHHIAKCDLGSRYAKEAENLNALEKKQLDDLLRKVLVSMCSYLLKNLPVQENQVIRDAKYLHPKFNLEGENCMGAFKRLANVLWDSLGNKKMQVLLNFNPNSQKFDFVDAVKKELLSLRLENLSDDFYSTESSQKSKVSRPSYWRTCYELAGLEEAVEVNKIDVEAYWVKVLQLKDEDGKVKYKNIGTLALHILLLPHGNSDPERGFSINKRLLEKHGTNIDGETLESLRIIKDYIIQAGGVEEVITPKMMESCKNSYSKYTDYLNEKKRQESANKVQLEKEKEEDREKKDVEELDAQIDVIKGKIRMADDLIADGNKLLKACVKKMVPAIFTEGQEKVELGVKRKAELSKNLEKLSKKKK